MVELTRLTGSKLTVNADLIELLEASPDTVISMTTGRRLIVRESVAEVVRLVIEYRSQVFGNLILSCKSRPLDLNEEALANG